MHAAILPFGEDLDPDLHARLDAQQQDPGWFHAEVTDVEGRLAGEPDRALLDGGQCHVVPGGSSHAPKGEVAPDEEAAIVCDGNYPRWVSVYRTGDRIQQAQTTSGANERCNGWLGILLYMLGGFNMVYYQSQLNKVWDRHGNPEEGTLI